MDRMSVFYPADNEVGHVQAVILESDYPVYQKIGFVSSADDVKPIVKKTKTKAATDGGNNN
ncbi:hypothetical protein V1956_20095 [Yersinia sp. 2540 StPb PI]|uniref:hypothetical protein n=1 Tax=Yersinia sp. 2540 StPb PI TaxID=3117406 RepID=UPI003FA441F6